MFQKERKMEKVLRIKSESKLPMRFTQGEGGR